MRIILNATAFFMCKDFRLFAFFALGLFFQVACQTAVSDNKNFPQKVVSTDTPTVAPVAEPRMVYKFDSTSFIIGCGKIIVQKISADYRNELNVQLHFTKAPGDTTFNIEDHLSRVQIEYSRYPRGNQRVDRICDDIAYADSGRLDPVVYKAVSGTVSITERKNKNFPTQLTITLTSLVVQNSKEEQILLPYEIFKDIFVGWLAG